MIKCLVIEEQYRLEGFSMAYQSELIVMLTYNDETIPQAHDVFLQCQSSKANYWGMKELPLPIEE